MKKVLAIVVKLALLILGKEKFYGIWTKLLKEGKVVKGTFKVFKAKSGVKYQLNISQWIPANIYFTGTYEEIELRFLERKLAKGCVVFDIGANIGWHTLHAAKWVGRQGKVYCFEPFEENLYHLRTNTNLNPVLDDRIVLVPKAVNEDGQSLQLYYDPVENNPGMVSSVKAKTESYKVEACTIDDFVEENSIHRIDLIKLDIEGGELSAIRGMLKTLGSFQPIILLELDEQLLGRKNKEQVLSILTKLGYGRFSILKDGSLKQHSDEFSPKNQVFVKVK